MPPAYDHVVVVIEENHAYNLITSKYASSAPFINTTLIAQGASFTRFFGEEHHSEGNYLWLFAGSDLGIGFGDPVPVGPFSNPNLGASLMQAGFAFKGYSEDLPAIGSTVTSSGAYARRHNPWVDFSNVPNGSTIATSSNLRMSDFPTDFTKLPTVAFVVPNTDNDMHNGTDPATIASGDAWLKNHLGAYYQWARTHDSLLIVTFDEDGGATAGLTNPATGANHIPTIVAGAGIVHGNYTEGNGATHFNLLRTLQDMYGLPGFGSQQRFASAAGIGSGAISDVYTQWNVDASGTWQTASNWNGNVIPSGNAAVANFLSAINVGRNVTLAAPVTVNVLNFDNPHGYTIGGNALLNLDAVAGNSAQVNVRSGRQQINAPINLAKDAKFSIGSNASLLVSRLLQSGFHITKTGGGTLITTNIRSVSLSISGGTVQISSGGGDGGTSIVTALNIAGGSAPSATLDLSDHALIVNSTGGSELQTIAAQLRSGYASGAWTGRGITSSAARAAAGTADKTGIGYGLASDVFSRVPATFGGQSVGSSSIILRNTLQGDANFDGAVNTIDFNLLAAHFGSAGARWTQGDFNYDGFANTSDLNILAGNFGRSIPLVASSAVAQSIVPEPGALSALLLGFLVLLRRPRAKYLGTIGLLR